MDRMSSINILYAWGWTFLAGVILNILTLIIMGYNIEHQTDNTPSISIVVLMVLVSNFLRSSIWVSVSCMQSLMRLGVGTGVWYLFAGVMFPYVEHVTGRWLRYIFTIQVLLTLVLMVTSYPSQSPTHTTANLRLFNIF